MEYSPLEMNMSKSQRQKITDFLNVIDEDEVPSTARLYELFREAKSHGTANVQFLCALNIFTGGSKELSGNVISELLTLNKSNLTLILLKYPE